MIFILIGLVAETLIEDKDEQGDMIGFGETVVVSFVFCVIISLLKLNVVGEEVKIILFRLPVADDEIPFTKLVEEKLRWPDIIEDEAPK